MSASSPVESGRIRRLGGAVVDDDDLASPRAGSPADRAGERGERARQFARDLIADDDDRDLG